MSSLEVCIFPEDGLENVDYRLVSQNRRRSDCRISIDVWTCCHGLEVSSYLVYVGVSLFGLFV